jgi:hypothetical protein
VRNVNPAFQKSAAEGIDLQRSEPHSSAYHLYVLKSGLVTRNSDIVKRLKQNSRSAEKLLRQSDPSAKVTSNYVIAAGKNTTTFEDGVRRPSSAEFWAEATGLPEEKAVELVLAIATEAGRLVTRDASKHIKALSTLVETYLADLSDPRKVDWQFLKRRLFREKAAWAAEDRERHQRALNALQAIGYAETKQVAQESAAEDSAPQDEIEGVADPEDAPG